MPRPEALVLSFIAPLTAFLREIDQVVEIGPRLWSFQAT